MADLRGAVIGYGLAGSVFHAPLIASTPGLAVSTVVTGNPQRQAEARKAHPDSRVVPDPAEVFERASEHYFVVVAAPNNVHVELTHRALDAGLPVVVDKPLAPTAAEARSLVEQAEAAGVLITPYMNRRWDSDQLTLRRLLDEGKLGEVLRYESRLERWQPALSGRKPWTEVSPPEAGGGVLLDLGTHLVDQAIVLFGPVARVYAELESRRGGAADDDAFVALEHSCHARSPPTGARRSRGLRRHGRRRAGGCAPLGRPPGRRRGVGRRTTRALGPADHRGSHRNHPQRARGLASLLHRA